MSDHGIALAEERSLALHRLIAERLREDPALLDAARERVRRWLAAGPVPRPAAEAWRVALEGSLEDVVATLVDPASIAQDDEIVVIGSQAILGAYPDAPEELCVSADADVYPRNHPERAELIDGSIGELSPFDDSFGYYAQGVGVATAVLPEGWEGRLVSVPTSAGTGLCLEPHDLAVSKYVAAREKDREYVRAAVRHGLLVRETLLARLEGTPVDATRRASIREQVCADFEALGRG